MNTIEMDYWIYAAGKQKNKTTYLVQIMDSETLPKQVLEGKLSRK